MTTHSVYVGMSLTHAPDTFRTVFCGEFKEMLAQQPTIKVLDFVGLEAGNPPAVYRTDRQHVEEADLCLFICDHPSIGLGMEIAFRLETQKPMMCFARSDVKLTRMLTGMCAVHDVPLHRYIVPKDILTACMNYL